MRVHQHARLCSPFRGISPQGHCNMLDSECTGVVPNLQEALQHIIN